MKKGLLIGVGAMLLVACSSPVEDESENFKELLTEEYEAFKKNDEALLVAHFELLEVYKAQGKIDVHKPVFFSDKLKGVTLNFEDTPNAYQIMGNMFADSTTLGEGNKHFGKELKLKDLSRIVELPLDSFKPQFNDKGRFNEFERITTEILSEIANMEYVLVLKTKNKKFPTWYGNTYEPGSYEGRILVYDAKVKKLLASIEMTATNSTSVTAGDFGDLGKAVTADLDKNINEAFVKTLQNNFKLVGTPSKLQ